MRKYCHNESQACRWNFGFKLVFREKTYELYAPTRSDRDQWVRTLQSLAEMKNSGHLVVNSASRYNNCDNNNNYRSSMNSGANVTSNSTIINPFEFAAARERQLRQSLLDEQMSLSERNEASEANLRQ